MIRGLLLGLLLGAAACQDTAPTIGLAPPETILAGPTWKLSATFDTYDGVWHSLEATRTEFTLRFFADGAFVDAINGRTQQAGTWHLVADTLTLRIRTGGSYDARYQLRTLTPEQLELERMGRHGPVLYRYRPR